MHVYGEVGGGILASGLANRALFALLPGLLLVVAAVGFLIRDPAVQERLYDAIAEIVPPLASLLEDSLAIIAEGAFTFTVVGVIGLVWAASGFFQAMEVCFAVILGTRRRRDPVLRGIIGIGGVLVILASIVIIAVISVVVWGAPGGVLAQIVEHVPSVLLSTVGSALVMTVGLCLLYRFAPTSAPPWSLVWRPALAVGVVFALLTQLFSIITPLVAGLASLYGAIAAVFILLIWLQFGCNLIILGVAWLRILRDGSPDPASLPWPVGTADDPRAGRPATPPA
jgi:membrane protein